MTSRDVFLVGDGHVLDNGYVQLVESYGSDERVIEAARMSTAKGFKGWGLDHADYCPSNVHYRILHPGLLNLCECGRQPGDEKLLKFLWEHKHHTPFEMAGFVVEVQAPIFVFREWVRHRSMDISSFNELSGRYTEMPDLYYVPSVTRLMESKQSTVNKQSSEAGIGLETAKRLAQFIRDSHAKARLNYDNLIAAGVAREVARTVLPMAQYSRMRVAANLRCWMAFLTLRQDMAAQYEIRQYADLVATIVQQLFPHTWAVARGEGDQ